MHSAFSCHRHFLHGLFRGVVQSIEFDIGFFVQFDRFLQCRQFIQFDRFFNKLGDRFIQCDKLVLILFGGYCVRFIKNTSYCT